VSSGHKKVLFLECNRKFVEHFTALDIRDTESVNSFKNDYDDWTSQEACKLYEYDIVLTTISLESPLGRFETLRLRHFD